MINIIYCGFNDLNYSRGVENVIKTQSTAARKKYYLYFLDKKRLKISKYKNFIQIGIPKRSFFWPIIINIISFKIKKRHKTKFHSHNYLMSLFLCWKIDYMTVHDALFYQYKNFNKGNIIHKLIEKCVYIKTNNISFVSSYAHSESMLGNKKFSIIHNTSEKEIFYDNQSNLNEKFILIVRSLEKRICPELILEIAEKLKIENIDLKIKLAGKGPLMEYFQQEISRRRLNNLSLLGYVSDKKLISLYQKCLFTIVTARESEGFGLPVIDSYLFNKPVLASNVCAIPEVIMHTKYLVDNDADLFLEKIKLLLSNDLEKNYNSFYMKKFSNSIYERKIRDFYA